MSEKKENNIKDQEDIFRIDKPLDLPTYDLDFFNNTDYQSPYLGISQFDQNRDEVGELKNPTSGIGLKSPKSVRYSLLSQFGKGKDGIRTTNEKQSDPDNANNSRRNSERVLQTINLSAFNKVDKTKASFNAYIATSFVSFVLIFPFQVFLLANSVSSSKLNHGTYFAEYWAAAIKVCSGLLIFSRAYQLFITITALVTKNTIQALYLLVYLILIYISSAEYMLTYVAEADAIGISENTRVVKFATYWILVISGITILIQGILFFAFIRKEFLFLSFQGAKNSISARNKLLDIQNYRALLILNGFFILVHLIFYINFQNSMTFKAYDGAGALAMIMIGITPFVLVYCFFAVNKESPIPIIISMSFYLFIFAYSVTQSYLSTTFSVLPSSEDPENNNSLYYDVFIANFRKWFAFFHFTLIIANYVIGTKILSTTYESSSLPSATKKGKFFDKLFFRNFKGVGFNKHSNTISFPLDTETEKQADLKTKLNNLFSQNIVAVTIVIAITIAFQSYVFTEKKEYLRGWYTVSLVSILTVAFLSVLMKVIWKRNLNPNVKTLKTILMVSQSILFCWLNFILYQIFLGFNWNNNFIYYNIIYNYGDRETLEIKSKLLAANWTAVETDPKYSDIVEVWLDEYYKAANSFLSHGVAFFVLTVLSGLAVFMLLVYQSILFAKFTHMARKIKFDAVTFLGTQEPQVNSFEITAPVKPNNTSSRYGLYAALLSFNCYLILTSMTLVVTFNYQYYMDVPVYFELGQFLPEFYRTWRIVINIVFVFVVFVLLVLLKTRLKVLASLMSVLFIGWMGYVSYEIYFATNCLALIQNTYDQLNYFYFMLAYYVLQLILFLATGVGSVLIALK